jgi:hypothetical protein
MRGKGKGKGNGRDPSGLRACGLAGLRASGSPGPGKNVFGFHHSKWTPKTFLIFRFHHSKGVSKTFLKIIKNCVDIIVMAW